jgi:hypothetical protein
MLRMVRNPLPKSRKGSPRRAGSAPGRRGACLGPPRPLACADEIRLSPLDEVNARLVADKVQNRKDFLLYHRATQPRRAELEHDFELWPERLGVRPGQAGEGSGAG